MFRVVWTFLALQICHSGVSRDHVRLSKLLVGNLVGAHKDSSAADCSADEHRDKECDGQTDPHYGEKHDIDGLH